MANGEMDVMANGARAAVWERGSGPSLVLVHGLGGTSTAIFGPLIEPLAADHGVVGYDLRGAGASEATPGPYSIDLFVADLAALLDELALDRVAGGGHSLGGSITLGLAARHPRRVAAAVGLGAPTVLADAGREGLAARAETVEAQGMDAVAATVAANGTAPSFRERDPAAFDAFVACLA